MLHNVKGFKLRHNKLLNTYRVAYQCPGCGTAFSNPISEAGQVDACVDCGAQFHVPGESHKKRLQEEAARAQQDKDTKKRKAYEERMQRKKAHQDKLRREKADAQARAHAVKNESFQQAYRAPVSRPAVAESITGRDKKQGTDFGYFMYPPSLVTECRSNKYHNTRFPGLSLVIRLALNGSTFLYWCMVLIWSGFWGFTLLALLFGEAKEGERIIGLCICLIGAVITYAIICWTAIIRIAIADFLRTLLCIEENGRESLS